MESRFIDEPFDEEERQLMEAVESGNFQSVPKEEFEATMREIRDGASRQGDFHQDAGGRPTGNPGNGEGRRDAIPDAHQQHHPSVRHRRHLVQGAGVGRIHGFTSPSDWRAFYEKSIVRFHEQRRLQRRFLHFSVFLGIFRNLSGFCPSLPVQGLIFP